MAHLRRLGPQLVSPTPIRPHSPAGSPSRSRAPVTPAACAGGRRSPPAAHRVRAARGAHLRTVRATERLTGVGCEVCRERGGTPRQKAAFLGCDSPDGDEEATGEMCEELMQIFAGSPRSAPPGPTDCSAGGHGTVQPPSRNQNPLVKDQVPFLPRF